MANPLASQAPKLSENLISAYSKRIIAPIEGPTDGLKEYDRRDELMQLIVLFPVLEKSAIC